MQPNSGYHSVNMIRMKPKTAGITKRSESGRKSKRLINVSKRHQGPVNFDLPYLNEKEKNSFLSTKINLMPRLNNFYSDKGQRGELSMSTVRKENLTMYQTPKVTKSKTFKTEEGNKMATVAKMVTQQDSQCTYNYDSEEESESGGQNKTKESPIKKWLSHNRNFDIKINVVNGNEKAKGKLRS